MSIYRTISEGTMLTATIIFTILILSPNVLGNRIKRQSLVYDKATNSCTTPAPDLKRGTCTNIKQCPNMLTILKTKRTDQVAMKFLLSSVCFYEGKDPVVCCVTEAKSTTKFPNSTVCGLSDVKHNRVVGGQPAVLGAWPWIAALGYTTATKFDVPEWLCGGTLVNERYVVTAAHCLHNIGRRVLTVVRLGDLDLNSSNSDGATPVDIKVDKILIHEAYNASKHSTDIALVKLAQNVKFTNLIKPICLPFSADLISNTFEGYTPFLAGWGALSYKGPTTTTLQEVQINISNTPKCKQAYVNIKSATVDERVICAGQTGKDACQGDSGGPLMLPRGQNFYLIGIVSYGYKCAEPGYPGIYTRVTQFLDWIEKNVEL